MLIALVTIKITENTTKTIPKTPGIVLAKYMITIIAAAIILMLLSTIPMFFFIVITLKG